MTPRLAIYKNWGFPTKDQIDSTIRNRILPATGTAASSTWGDLGATVWQNAFEEMGFDMRIYLPERGGNSSNNYGCWYNTGSFSDSSAGQALRFYEWDGTRNNPSDSDPGNGTGSDSPASNTLAVCRFGVGHPETNAVPVVIPPFNYTAHEADSTGTADEHSGAFTQFYVSPFQLPFAYEYGFNFMYQNTLGKAYQFTSKFYTGATSDSGTPVSWSQEGGTSPYLWDVTTRVAWSVDRTDLCRVSNYSAQPDEQYGGGFVTWYPPLDGSPITAPVTLKAEWLTLDPTVSNGSKTVMRTVTRSITPQDGYRPYLDTVYVIPQNQVYDVSATPVTVKMTAIATYKDGRAIDISNDPDTTWSLTDSTSGQTLNSADTGGFQVLAGQSRNDLYLTSGLPSTGVTVKLSYSSRWASTDGTTPTPTNYSTKLQVVKAPPTISSITPSFGPTAGGNVIRINGTGFTEGSVAYFGGTPATSTLFVTSTQLTVTVPPGTVGAVPVLVVTNSSQTGNAADYNYTN